MKTDLCITFVEDKKQMSKRIHDYLKNKGATRAVVEYSGSGDSGCIDHTAVYTGEDLIETGDWEDFPSEGIGARAWNDETYKWEETPLDPEKNWLDFNVVFQEFCYTLLPGGWEINDGSSGTITLDIVENKTTLDHTTYYTECDTSVLEW
jgi:hypothetical protein